MDVIDTDKIKEILVQRASLESKLAKDMYGIFNKRPWIGKLRDFVCIAMTQIIELTRYAKDDLNAPFMLEQCCKGEKDLHVWNGAAGNSYINKLENLIHRKDELDAGDCSDLIRLFGAVVEDKNLMARIGSVSLDDDKSMKRVGRGDFWKSSRARDRYEKGKEPPPATPGRKAMLEQRRLNGFSGMERTRLLDQSTVKKIDIAFGLPQGCDISGTTADSAFFVDHVADFIGSEILGAMGLTRADIATMQLLPIATMVSQAHHTLLECALTLTLNGYIKYHAGYYNSLKPIDESYNNCFDNLLRDTSKRAKKLHIICYLDKDNVVRAFRMKTDNEVKNFEKVAEMSKQTLVMWKTMPLFQSLALVKKRFDLAHMKY